MNYIKKGDKNMLTPFVLPDNGVPVKIGDRSFVYQDVFHPIEWYNGEPYRTRVETLVLGNMGTTIFLRIDKENHKYRIPGGSVDDDSSYEKQAENETNEEALLAVKDLVFSGITYQEKMDKDFLKKGHDFPIAYVGAFNYVYIAIASGKVDKSTIEKKDLDDDMATNGKFYPINEVAGMLHRYHLEALCNSNKVNPTMKILLQKNLSERFADNANKPIFECDDTFIAEDDDLSYIYHGSTYDIDVFHPMSLDLGNGKEKPGWSTFCFRNPDYARNFALMRLIQKKCGDKPETKCGWDLKERRPYVYNKVLNEIRKSVIGEKFYVYKIDAENLELGLGNDVRFAEVTFREDNVKPVDRETYYVDINLLNDIVKVIDVEPKKYEKSQMDTKNFDRGWLACMINRDYSGDSAVAKLTKAVSDGKLKPGDDVEAYMTDNGIDMEDIDFIRRMSELSESFDISGDYEETLLLGDNKVIFTSTNMNLYCEDRTDSEAYLLPKSKTFPNDAKIQYKRYMYHIDDKGNPFLMAMSDFTSFSNDKEVLGCMRIFVRPTYRKNKLGTILVGDMFRYLFNVTPMRIAVEVHDDIANKEGIRKWIGRYGFSEIGKPSKHTTGFVLQMSGPTGHKDIFEKGDFSEYAKYADLNGARGEITTEQELNLTDFYMYSALFPIKGKNPKDSFNWDIDQYYKTIDSAIHNEICHCKANNVELGDKFSLWMYTLYDEDSSMYIGKVAVYMHGDEFDWEWEEQEPIDYKLIGYLREEVQRPLLLESVTNFDSNFKPKGYMQLSKFRKIKVDKTVIDKYKAYASTLDELDPRNATAGYVWVDENNNFVGVCTVEYNLLEKFNWITSIEVANEYRGYGLGKQLLDFAVKSLKGNTLSVWVKNPVAMQMYEEYGFKPSKASIKYVEAGKGSMYFMYLPSKLSPSDIKSANEVVIPPAEESLVQENVVFNKDNTAYNVDKFENGKTNILFVTGLSGSGKTTLSQKIAVEFNAEWIELDCFEQCYAFTDSQLKEAGEVFYDYLSSHKALWDKLKAKEIKGEELGKEIKKFLHYCISWCRKRKDKKFVIDGVQIYCFLDSSVLKSEAVIITGTSAKNSLLQRLKRDGHGKIEWGKELKNEFPNLLAWYWEEEKYLKSFEKDMKTNAITEFVIADTSDIEIVDLTTLETANIPLQESLEENKRLEPIFIVLSFTGTPFGKLITMYQHCKFSHAALSLDSKLDKLYTFNMRMDKEEIEKNGKTVVKSRPAGGADIEHLKDYYDVSTGGDADICVMCIFVTQEVKRAVKQTIDKIFANVDKTRYSLSNVLNIVVNRAIDTTDSLKMVCSQFVDNVLKMANIDITHKSSNLVSPNDFAKLPSTNSHVFVLFEGKKDQYNSKAVDNKVRYIKNSDQYGDLDVAKSNPTGLVAESVNEEPFYFYHLVPKGSNISKGITSLQYQYDSGNIDMFRKNSDKYRDRLCGGWDIYPEKNPSSLTDDEVLNGIKTFRNDSENGANRIYLFLYPPFKNLGTNMKNILLHKDIYRINLNDKNTLKYISGIDWGYDGSDSRNNRLTKEYYETVTKEEYFSKYTERGDGLPFSYMNHISIIPKYGYIPKQCWERIDVPETIDDTDNDVEFKTRRMMMDIYKRNPERMLTESGVLDTYKKSMVGKHVYHGSYELYDMLEPTGLDMGNKLESPGWSLYTWKNRENAIGWGIFQTVKKINKVHHILSDTNCLYSHIMLILDTEVDKLIEVIESLPDDSLNHYYVYDIPITPDMTIGLGHSSNTRDCITIRTPHIKYIKVTKYRVTKEDIFKYCQIVTASEMAKLKTGGFNHRHSWLLMNNDLMFKFIIKDKALTTIKDAISSGELVPGESIEEFMKEKGLEFDKVSFFERLMVNFDDSAEGIRSRHQKVFEAEGDDELPDVGKENEASDYTEDAQKSVEDNADDGGEDNTENDAGTPEDVENDLEDPNYDEEGGEDNTDAEGGTPEDVENDLEDPNYDNAGGDEGTDDTQTDTTDAGGENENQTNNNTIKNYSILRDFDGLFRLANDMSKTLEPIIMEKPIQNKVLTQVKENLSAIKNEMKDFIILHYKPDNYAFNLYYYELFASLINKNLQILEKNKLFSTEDAKKSMNSKSKKIKEVN